MTRNHRFLTLAAAISALSIVAWSPLAYAQVECKANETQAECHARLKCKPDEELEDCKQRLQNQGGDQGGDRGGDRGSDRGDRGDRGRDGGGNDRGNRGDRGDRGDRGGDDRNDRDNNARGRDRDDGDRGDRGGRRDDGGGRRGQRSGRRGRAFEANKTFGFGLELGEPSGLSGKYFLSDNGALDFGLGWVYEHYYYGDGVHLYADYLHHPLSLTSAAAFELPLYIGVGLRYWDFDYCYLGRCDYGGSAIGIRVPFGIAFDFNNLPLDIFLQLVPVLDFVRGDYSDRYDSRSHFGVDFSAGIRFWP